MGRALQTTWSMIGIALVLVLVLDGALDRMLRKREDAQLRAFLDRYPDPDHSWVPEYLNEVLAEDAVDWRPYVYWRRRPYEGKYFGVDSNGLRRTWNAPPQATGKVQRIFAFGGSTMWGTHVRPEYTLPSCLSRQLTGRGYHVEVTNFGEGGYVSTQELITLMLELRKGNVPDVVVFYDGVNDVAASYQNAVAGWTENESNRVAEFNVDRQRSRAERLLAVFPALRRFATGLGHHLRGPYALEAGTAAAVEADTARVYRENVRLVSALADEYGFDTLFYWQPIIHKKDHLAPNEAAAEATQAASKDFVLGAYAAVGADAALKSRRDFHDISDMFRTTEEPVYADFCHLSEHGNELVARRIGEDVGGVLESRAARSR
ncbi:MAG TPA: SGNH/GDSL hydrolase family protein [Polyangiaceae bacterium]|nr:SGNH/GDSL hydrolase family protein [Polyangiaceae bacterium]